MTDWRFGTMGFGYDDWAGPFYPPGVRRADWLAHFARHFNAVELDTTFYGAPARERVRHWAASVPDGFRFCAKAPRIVTHELPLDQAAGPMGEFLDVMREMGERLGAVLLQFPPSFTFEQADALETFLHAVPRGGVPLAVELRNRSWGTPRTLELLKGANCCCVMAEYASRPGRLFVTSDFLYVRWVGQHGRFDRHVAERIDVSESLAWWQAELGRVAPRVQTVYGFFNNDFAGYGIGTCNRFKAMLGLPVTEAIDEGQGTLFS